jgi:hypothetical protein
MWSNEFDAPTPGALEDWLRSADGPPQPTMAFRQQVLAEALQARRQSESLQRVQVLSTMFLGMAVMLGLPGYYHGLRDESQPPPTLAATVATVPTWLSRTAFAVAAVSRPMKASDDYEWNLVQAEFAVRDQSARLFRGAL